LESDSSALEDVGSALAQSISAIYERVQAGEINPDDLESLRIPDSLGGEVRGSLNLIRVGLVHARAVSLISAPEEILEGTFASTFLSGDLGAFASHLMRSQDDVVSAFLGSDLAPSVSATAQIGLAIDTLADFTNYVRNLTDGHIRSFNNVVVAGQVTRSARYAIAPVSRMITEIDGQRLHGLCGMITDVIINWTNGLGFVSIPRDGSGLRQLEDLIAILYSKVQYLLPWGLYAFDRIVGEEAERRNIVYEHQVQDLAYLVDAGVPTFDALRLAGVGLERVDATRLSSAFRRERRARTDLDLFTWLVSLRRIDLETILRGQDLRRIDADLDSLLADIRSSLVSHGDDR
jgi:hypothetical protein